jgi:hypothetical protein
LSLPTPCSPVIVPPRSNAASVISEALAKAEWRESLL